MKKMKKILAFLMAMVMVLGMTMTAFADETDDTTDDTTPAVVMPTAADTAEAKVLNVETGVSVTAYHIVEAKYDESGAGFIGYQVVAKDKNGDDVDIDIANPENPTPAEVGAIAADADLLGKLVSKEMDEVDGEDGTYAAMLNAGYWLVLIKEAAGTVYNPMIVGVYYSESGTDNTMSSDPLDVTQGWDLIGETAYAKSTKPEVKKEITDEKKDAAVGSDVSFKITTAIPSYGPEYINPVVKITDTLSEGLSFNDDIKVTVGNTEITADAADAVYEVTSTTNGFELTFKPEYVMGDGNGQAVVVEYTAKLTGDNIGVNFVPNTNTAKMTYTNDPTTNNTADTEKKKTYTYTFGIDAELYGNSKETWNKVTEEILKTGEKREVTREDGTKVETTRLDGAVFTLSKDDEVVATETSDEFGRLSFRGLETGTYTLKETKAPEEYALSTESLTVVIEADYNDDGTLNWYSITINGKVSKYTAEYVNGEVTKIETDSAKSIEGDTETTTVSNTTGFVNTKLSSLPSTGGIGTTIFTIGGCIIMIVAAGLFFATRRKSTK